MFSFSTLLGIIAAVAIFCLSIQMSTDNYMLFISIASILMVSGGTLAASLISFNSRDMLCAIAAIFQTLLSDKVTSRTLKNDIARFIEWSKIYRNGGINALENSLSQKEAKDEFLSLAIELMGSGHDKKAIREMLSDFADSRYIRGSKNSKILAAMSGFAPGFGMVGTVIGLIIMLDNMNGDIAALGKGLALALITTLYGILLAQLIFKPSSLQSLEKIDSEFFRHQMLIEGFNLLIEKKDSVVIQDRLNSFLKPKARFTLENK